ncbi:Baseplate J-like protein [compost metagenome]
MRALPPPEFVRIDPAQIESDLIARYEQRSGKTLYPAQIERLFIDQLAYQHTLTLAAIQHSGEQLLARFSKGPILDYLAELVGVSRLLATPSRCTLRLTLASPAITPLTLSAGTLVCSQDSKVQVATAEAVTIAASQRTATVPANSTQTGAGTNGWAIGQLNTLVSPIAGLSVSNITVTSGGADEELDASLAERVMLAPEAYSNAGSRGAYRFHARSVHPSIIDVVVHGPDEGQPPGQVALYPLTASGLPSAELLRQVEQAINGEKVRPLNDTVIAVAPVEVRYEIRARLTFYTQADRETALRQAQAAAEAYAAEQRTALGRDIVPEQIISALQVPGVYRAQLDKPTLRDVASHEWANCSAIVLTDVGVTLG